MYEKDIKCMHELYLTMIEHLVPKFYLLLLEGTGPCATDFVEFKNTNPWPHKDLTTNESFIFKTS